MQPLSVSYLATWHSPSGVASYNVEARDWVRGSALRGSTGLVSSLLEAYTGAPGALNRACLILQRIPSLPTGIPPAIAFRANE
jgi:hypothetical protein